MVKTLRSIVLEEIREKKFVIRDQTNKELDGRVYEILELVEWHAGITFLDIKYENGQKDRKNLNYLLYVSGLVNGDS